MGDPVRVGVVASDPVLEAGARITLSGSPDVALAVDGEPAQVVVVMVDRVDDEHLDLARSARSGPGRTEVVLVATDLVLDDALTAISAGARGLLRRREADADRLTRTVLAAAGGDCTVPPDLLDGLLEQNAAALPTPGPAWTGPGLSDREKSVLALIADGLETDEIAKEMCYSTRTVTGIVHDITHRFRLRNRAHAVAFAVRAGLL